jgi:hypothetical protein
LCITLYDKPTKNSVKIRATKKALPCEDQLVFINGERFDVDDSVLEFFDKHNLVDKNLYFEIDYEENDG